MGAWPTVIGEAGIGKSRLVEALLAAAAADGATVLAARAFPSEGSIAYAPIVELLRTGFTAPGAAGASRGPRAGHARGGRAPRAAPSGRPPRRRSSLARRFPGCARVRLLEAIATVLAVIVHGRSPGIVAVEDLHWADDASREALLYLARRLAGRPMLLLLARRPEDLEGGAHVLLSTAAGPARRRIGHHGSGWTMPPSGHWSMRPSRPACRPGTRRRSPRSPRGSRCTWSKP